MKFLPFSPVCLAIVATAMGVFTGTEQARAARALGIDVSSYQGGSINWTSVKSSGISFAWSKATEGVSITDADYSGNISRGKAAGVYMGGYDFTHPEDNTPAAEAAHFWSVTKNNTKADGLTLNPMLDMEVFNGITGASSYSAWVNDWCTDIVQDAANNGVKFTPAIYTSACHANQFNSSVAQWYDDIANYNGEDPQTGTPWSACSSYNVWGAWDFWQYSSTLPVSGISDGSVDHDVYDGTEATLLSTQVAIANTNSAIFYWDPQKAAAANPFTGSMTGSWESSLWSPGSAGQATPLAWVNGKAACFGVHTGSGTPAYTITMNSSHVVAGFFDGALAPNSCDVTISGTGTIDLASGPQGLDSTISSDGVTGKLRIYCDMAGSGELYPEGDGQSFLHGNNSYSGGTVLGYHDANGSNPFSGTVYFNNGSAFGTGTITLQTYGTGGALVLEGTAAVTVPNAVTVASATTNNIVGNAAGLTFSGNWSMGAHLLALGTGATAGYQTIISGVVSGSAGLTVYNKGTLVLSGANTYTGTTTITSPAVLTIDGAGKLGSGSYAGAMVNGGTLNYSSTASQTLSGVISGAGPLKQSDVGTLILTGVNTYTGATTVGSGSTLCVNADSGLGATSSALTLNGGCLKNNNSTPSLSASRTITLGASGGYFDAGGLSKPVTVNSKLTGAGALLINLDGSPVVLVNVTNNYTGNTIIGTNGPGYATNGTQAWLKLGAAGVIPNGSGFGNVIINQAYLGLLDLAGFSQIVNGLSGDGTVDSTSGNGALTVGNNNATSTFNGVIQDSVGALTLTKIGTGTLTLGGSNTFSGNTTISAGTLALGAAGSLNGTPKITLAAGTTFDVSAIGSYALGGATTLSASGNASPATIIGGTTVSLGSRPILLTYDGSHPALTVTQGALSLNGNAFTVNGSQLPLGTYTIIQQTSGTVAAAGSFTVTGTATGAAGTVAGISVVGGNVNLVIANPTTTTLAPLTNSIYGQPATFTATVAPALSSGTVQFYDNGASLGDPVALNAGMAAFSTNTLSAGNHPITAAYSGTTGYAASVTTSSSIQQVTLSTNNVPVTIGGGTTLQTNGTFQFSFTGTPGYTYLIQATDDLTPPVDWTDVSTNTADINGQVTFTDTDTNVYVGRYYRTALP